MLRLNISKEPRWLDLGLGVRVQVRPPGLSIIAAARRDADFRALGPDADPEEMGVALAIAVARRAILAWEGVGDEKGKPVPVSDAAVAALLEVLPIFNAWQAQYVDLGMMAESEKNGSAPSPSGTSAGAPTTAGRAKGRARTARKS